LKKLSILLISFVLLVSLNFGCSTQPKIVYVEENFKKQKKDFELEKEKRRFQWEEQDRDRVHGMAKKAFDELGKD